MSSEARRLLSERESILERRELEALKILLERDETEEASEGRRVSGGEDEEDSKWAYRESTYKQTSTRERECVCARRRDEGRHERQTRKENLQIWYSGRYNTRQSEFALPA